MKAIGRENVSLADVRARLAICVGLTLITAPAVAAHLSLPPVPHYETPFPLPPGEPIRPPRYTERQTPDNAPKNDEGKRKTLWQRLVAIANRTLEDPVALFTFVLAGSTIGLWIVTWRSANAARDAAEALPALERAYVFIEISPNITTDMDRRLHPVGSERREPHIDYQFVNHGQTPAIIKAMSAEFGHWTSLPSEIRYIDIPLQAEVVIRSGDVYPAPMPFSGNTLYYQETKYLGWELTAEEINDLSAGHSFLWFYGHIVYDDVFGRPHETTFCWCYNGLANSFAQYGGNKYNYRT